MGCPHLIQAGGRWLLGSPLCWFSYIPSEGTEGGSGESLASPLTQGEIVRGNEEEWSHLRGQWGSRSLQGKPFYSRSREERSKGEEKCLGLGDMLVSSGSHRSVSSVCSLPDSGADGRTI